MNFHIHHLPSHHHQAGHTEVGFRPAWENIEELGDEVDRGPQGKTMVPTDAISHISGYGHLQLLRVLCFLFTFVSPCQECVCIYIHGLVSPVIMWVCVCVCFWPRADAQMKVSGEELPRRKGMRHPQTEGRWSKYLCCDPVQGGKEEWIDNDNSKNGSHVCN